LVAGFVVATVVLKSEKSGSFDGASTTSPAADFIVSVENVWAGSGIQFTNASTGGGGIISSTRWDFGDGTMYTGPIVENPVHVYASPGTYVVTLTVTDTTGATNTCSKSISVAYPPPIANFSFLPENIKVKDSTQFADNSIGRMGTITNWVWKFGDGTESTVQNPTHSYSSPGVYTIALTVRDNNAHTSTCTKSISVSQIKNFVWSYGGRGWTQDLEIVSEVDKYENMSHAVYIYGIEPIGAYLPEDAKKFVTPSDPTIKSFAENLKANYLAYQSASEEGLANFVLRFVQEAVTYDVGENLYLWRYALETLVAKTANCTEKSILYATLLEALDYQTALIDFGTDNHMMVGVHFGSAPTMASSAGYLNKTVGSFTEDNVVYWPAETTSTDWNVGERESSLHTLPWDMYILPLN